MRCHFAIYKSKCCVAPIRIVGSALNRLRSIPEQSANLLFITLHLLGWFRFLLPAEQQTVSSRIDASLTAIGDAELNHCWIFILVATEARRAATIWAVWTRVRAFPLPRIGHRLV